MLLLFRTETPEIQCVSESLVVGHSVFSAEEGTYIVDRSTNSNIFVVIELNIFYVRVTCLC